MAKPRTQPKKRGLSCWVLSRSVSIVLVRVHVEVVENEVVDTEEVEVELTAAPNPSAVKLRGAIAFYVRIVHKAVLDFGDGLGPQEYRKSEVGPSFFAAGSSISSIAKMLADYPWDKEDIDEAVELGGPKTELIVRVPMSAATGKPSKNWIYLPCDEGDQILSAPVRTVETSLSMDRAVDENKGGRQGGMPN